MEFFFISFIFTYYLRLFLVKLRYLVYPWLHINEIIKLISLCQKRKKNQIILQYNTVYEGLPNTNSIFFIILSSLHLKIVK